VKAALEQAACREAGARSEPLSEDGRPLSADERRIVTECRRAGGLCAHPARRAGWFRLRGTRPQTGAQALSQRHTDAGSPAGSRHASQPQSLSM
jgi:hypothetical protein